MNIISFKFWTYESETVIYLLNTVSNLYDCIMQIIFDTQFALNFASNKVIYLAFKLVITTSYVQHSTWFETVDFVYQC